MGLSPPVYRDAAFAGAVGSAVLASLSCDVSFVSDESEPPHVMVGREIETSAKPQAAGLYWNVFDRMRGEYEIGGFLPHPSWVMTRIRQGISAASVEMSDEEIEQASRFFNRVNQVMFEQQTLSWLAGAEFKLNLFGAGWENHPTLASHARGPIENDTTRLAIYRASRINLQANAYGAVRPRLLEGIGAGGFFLMRFCPADLLERFFPPVWEFCSARGITSNEELEELATPGVRTLLAFAGRTIGIDILREWPSFVAHLRSAADSAYTHCAAALWAQYPAVAFSTRDELIGMVGKYLYDVPERMRLAEEMRRQLNARFAHVQVNRRMLTRAAKERDEIAA